MVNTYQHISFAQLVYFSYVCGEALLATNTYRSNAAIFLLSRNLPLDLLVSWKNMTSDFLAPFKLILFPSVHFFPRWQFRWLCLQVKRHPLTPRHIFGSTKAAREIIWQDGVGRSGSQKSRHWFKDSVAAHISLDRPSLFPGRSLCSWKSRGSSPGGEPHETGLTHQAGVERCVRCCCCWICCGRWEACSWRLEIRGGWKINSNDVAMKSHLVSRGHWCHRGSNGGAGSKRGHCCRSIWTEGSRHCCCRCCCRRTSRRHRCPCHHVLVLLQSLWDHSV